jgi:hypothetical protein
VREHDITVGGSAPSVRVKFFVSENRNSCYGAIVRFYQSRFVLGIRALGKPKSLESRIFGLELGNLLKSHEMAKTFVGKAWHWNHRSLEMFGIGPA